MLLFALLLQYLALFGFSQTGRFLFLRTETFSRILAWFFLVMSVVLAGLSVGWQAGIPIWFGSVTLFGFVVIYAKAIQQPNVHIVAIGAVVLASIVIRLGGWE